MDCRALPALSTLLTRTYLSVNSVLAACCGPEEAFHSVEFQGAEEHELERVHVQLPSSSHIFSHTPVLPVPPILLLPPLPHAIPGVAAGGEPGWSWTTTRRPHRGPRGGDPAREAAPEAGPGSPAPRTARPQSPKSH